MNANINNGGLETQTATNTTTTLLTGTYVTFCTVNAVDPKAILISARTNNIDIFDRIDWRLQRDGVTVYEYQNGNDGRTQDNFTWSWPFTTSGTYTLQIRNGTLFANASHIESSITVLK